MNGYPRILCLSMIFLAAPFSLSETHAKATQALTAHPSEQTIAADPTVKHTVSKKRREEVKALREKLQPKDPIKTFGQNGYCISCHQDETPAIFEDWVKSPHAKAGVGCADCHTSGKGGSDSVPHFERFHISPIVTPFDCSKCHKNQRRGYATSAHANSLKSLQDMKENDPRYPVIAQYKDDDFVQCAGCHGSTVRLTADNKPDPATWPNKGAGRSNHDKSHGNCSSCHLGHRFSLQAARRPETCLRCHDGDNYPEGDIYRHAAHGTLFETLAKEEVQDDRLGIYLKGASMVAPTCAYCHMNGAGQGNLNRHDPSWLLPRDLSSPKATLIGNAKKLRKNMKAVCNQCHGVSFTDRFFTNADKQLAEYQKTIVEPGLAEWQEKLPTLTGAERKKALREYSQFLAEGKRYRMNLYMGKHGRVQR